MSMWSRRKILIWGKTRPELSKTYKETVCTGGVFADTKELVRLYPIPLRYLDDELVFKKYQWIEADVRKAIRDPRKESYNIRLDSIVVGEAVPTKNGDWSDRAAWILQRAHIFPSVEALQNARESQGITIGIVKPHEVLGFQAEPYSDEEKRCFWSKHRRIVEQGELQYDAALDKPVRPLNPPDYRFQIKFRCPNSNPEKVHVFTVFDWEVDALYFRCKSGGDSAETACSKVIDKLRTVVCAPNKDTYFFLGNIATHPQVFTIVGLWYPTLRASSPDLFDGLE